MKRMFAVLASLSVIIAVGAAPVASDTDISSSRDTVVADTLAILSRNAEARRLTTADAARLAADAAAAYEEGRFAEAVAFYTQLEAISGASATLYYNMGNAYYKDKQYAHAIVQYERCLLVNPAYPDAAANLELARMHTTDKIESIRPVIFAEWSRAVRDLFPCGTWAAMAVTFFLVFIVGLFAYFFIRRTVWRKVGFFGGLVAILLCLLSLHYAGAQYDKLILRDRAVVMTPTVTVRSSPADSGTALFPLHEGTTVRVRSRLGDWAEIELADGNVGWMPAADIEVI